MNEETTIDWQCWELEEPPPDFADRVMDAIVAEPRPSAAFRRSKRSARAMGWLTAAAVAAGSLTVLAMIEENARRKGSIETKRVPSEHAAAVSSQAPVDEAPTADHALLADVRAARTVVDRALRDRVRAELVPPLEDGGLERDPHTGLTIPSGTGHAHNLSKEYIQARIREDFFPLGRACYESALAKRPDLRGQIVVDFMIVGDARVGGIVDQAKINDRTDITDAEFTECIRQSMLSMVFAAPENDGWITVTYPFLFSPTDEDGEHD